MRDATSVSLRPGSIAWLVVATLSLGCEKPTPTPAERSASSAAATPAPPSAKPAASHPAPTASPEAPASASATPLRGGAKGPCVLDRGLAGTIGDARAFAWLRRTGREVAGSYLYEKVGRELALKGTFEGDSFTLTETLERVTTGTFTGACLRAGGIAGTWSSPDGKRTLPFWFAIPERLTVATRKVMVKTPSKVKDDGGEDCDYEREMPVVLGASSKEIEDRMTAAITDANKELLDPTWERRARACDRDEDGMRLTWFRAGFSVVRQDASMLVLELSGALNSTPSAHPSNFVGASVLDLDVTTGRPIAITDVVKDPAALLKLASSCSDADLGRDLEDASPAYLFLPRGIRVVGTSYGHAIAALTFQGPEIAYAALLRDGLLKADSPIAREWAGEKAAARGDSPCRVRWQP